MYLICTRLVDYTEKKCNSFKFNYYLSCVNNVNYSHTTTSFYTKKCILFELGKYLCANELLLIQTQLFAFLEKHNNLIPQILFIIHKQMCFIWSRVADYTQQKCNLFENNNELLQKSIVT